MTALLEFYTLCFIFFSPQRSASVVAANSPMLSVPDPLASGGDIKQNKFSRKSIGSSPTKQNSPEEHVPNGKNSVLLYDCSIRVFIFILVRVSVHLKNLKFWHLIAKFSLKIVLP